jgi:glc operon protein GlcG
LEDAGVNEFFTVTPRLTLAGAKRAGQVAEDFAAANGWLIAVAIVDHSGAPIYLARMEDAILAVQEGALNKAITAFKFARPTKALEEHVANGRLHYLTFDNMLCVEGGLPIVAEGRVVGGIGIGGGPSGREAVKCAQAALDALCAP